MGEDPDEEKGVHKTRTAGSQSSSFLLEVKPRFAWFPNKTAVLQSCSTCVPALPIAPQWLSPKGMGIPRVPQNQEGRDVLGTAGLQWGH